MPRVTRLGHTGIYVEDLARMRDFYTRVLGLRLVKKTVNQDDPTVYHLFYADEEGSPGADITFFGFAVPPADLTTHWVVLEEPPADRVPVTEAWLLTALAHELLREDAQARTALARALDVAAPEYIARPF